VVTWAHSLKGAKKKILNTIVFFAFSLFFLLVAKTIPPKKHWLGITKKKKKMMVLF